MDDIDTEFFFTEDLMEIGFTIKSKTQPFTKELALQVVEALLEAAFNNEVQEKQVH